MERIDIWSLIGFVLFIYGLLILGTGIYYLFVPDTTSLSAALHPAIWWGILLMIVGSLLNLKLFQKREKN